MFLRLPVIVQYVPLLRNMCIRKDIFTGFFFITVLNTKKHQQKTTSHEVRFTHILIVI